jgi:Uri superfamily endonuclease
MSDSGVYIAIFYLPGPRSISVGKLGRINFRPGLYFYVGSAQRNLSARLRRHSRQDKPLRWHIDYLSAKAEMLGVITVAGPRERECRLAKRLGRMFELAAPGFGASDCRCAGHLFYAPQLCPNFKSQISNLKFPPTAKKVGQLCSALRSFAEQGATASRLSLKWKLSGCTQTAINSISPLTAFG